MVGEVVIVIPEGEHAHADDEDIAQEAEPVGTVAEEEEAQDGGEDDLGVVVDGQLPGGSTAIGGGDAELPSRAAGPGAAFGKDGAL